MLLNAAKYQTRITAFTISELGLKHGLRKILDAFSSGYFKHFFFVWQVPSNVKFLSEWGLGSDL